MIIKQARTKYLISIVLIAWSLLFQFEIDLSAQTILSANSTGETTGHIGNLSIENPSIEDLEFSLLPCFIPSRGDHQSYVLPYPISITVPAGETVTVPLRGYCADVFTPPVPADELLPAFETWITKDPTMYGPGGIKPQRYFDHIGLNNLPKKGQTFHEQHLSVFPYSAGVPELSMTVPNIRELTGRSGPIQVISNHFEFSDQSIPEVFPVFLFSNQAPATVIAPLIIDAAEKIVQATERQQSDGTINTPFSSNPDKEYETIVQHTIWIYTSALTGQNYSFDDFSFKLFEQFTESAGFTIHEIPEEIKIEADKGASSFWNSFNRVGTQTKIIKVIETDEYFESR